MIMRVFSVNRLYLHIDHASGYIEEKNGNKYLTFDSVDENKEVFKKICKWMELKTK